METNGNLLRWLTRIFSINEKLSFDLQIVPEDTLWWNKNSWSDHRSYSQRYSTPYWQSSLQIDFFPLVFFSHFMNEL